MKNTSFYSWLVFVYPMLVIVAAYVVNPDNVLGQLMSWVTWFFNLVK